jgi:hypothetical protein
MRHTLLRVSSTLALAATMAMVSTLAHAQGTSSISGLVVDSSGGVVPGADVVVKNNGTNAVYTAVTGESGAFSVPMLNPGTYTVTVSLMGFKTVVLNDVVLNTGVPASVRATLEPGAVEETVVLNAAAEIIQTRSSAVTTTLNTDQLHGLPMAGRSALNFITFLPGVDTPAGSRDSTIMGLPQSTINMTIDGMNIQDNSNKNSDGFFVYVHPRIDAIEEISVSSVAQGAESVGEGAVQIRYTTRSGTNVHRGSTYYYTRRDWLNTNTWFNIRDRLPKAAQLLNEPGVRVGGPIVIPGLWDGHNKGFFFVNFEYFRQPQDITRDRTILHPRAQAGVFRYNVSVGGETQIREVDLLALAASKGQLSTMDPVIAKLLADIRASTVTTGTITALGDPRLQRFTFTQPSRSTSKYPTVRLDFNLTNRHRLTFSSNYQHSLGIPDTTNNYEARFPGFPYIGSNDWYRYTWQTTLRSTLGKTLVNEARVGGTGGAVYFSKENNPGWFKGSVANQDGFHLNINAAGITNAIHGSGTSGREPTTRVVEDRINWLKGSHSLTFGGSFTEVDYWTKATTNVPTVNFGIVTGDPASSLFTLANFPGASNADLSNAQTLYAVLTGRISSITGDARLNEKTDEYVYLGQGVQKGRLRDLGFFAQDSWRIRRDLTLNFGLRYELQLPFYPLNNSWATATMEDVWGVTGVGPDFNPGSHVTGLGYLFQPGVLKGRKPTFIRYAKGTKAYNTDWNNFAPNVGAAWTPRAEGGVLRRILGGGGETVIRGGFTMGYDRYGMGDFTGVFGANPGVQITANRELALGNLGTLPLLFREKDRLGPPEFSKTQQYPLTEVVTGDVRIYDPNLQVPSARTYTLGLQRAVSRNMVVEVRYVGSRSKDDWLNYNYNELNIVENGFLDEFKLAQANLLANIAAGRGSTFRYSGPGTGTSPLPIFLAYFSGVSRNQAGDASKYTSSLFANNTFVSPLAIYNPAPFTAADALDADAGRRANALAAGLPANLLVANPDLLGGAIIRGNGGYTRYNSAQVELRRRMSQGLQFQLSYVYGVAYEASRYSFRRPWVTTRRTGSEGGVTHAFKWNWVYDLPVGQGKRFLGGAGSWLDRVVGGWQVTGTGRVQSGRMLDFGNVRLVGMTKAELAKSFELRIDGNRRVWMLPQDIIDNTVKAYSVSATSVTGYGPLGPPQGRYFAPANGPDCIEIAGNFGDCGLRSVLVTGPKIFRFDLSAGKRFPIKGSVNFEVRGDVFNVFNYTNFTPVTGLGSSPVGYEVTGATDSGRTVQLMFRINW